MQQSSLFDNGDGQIISMIRDESRTRTFYAMNRGLELFYAMNRGLEHFYAMNRALEHFTR